MANEPGSNEHRSDEATLDRTPDEPPRPLPPQLAVAAGLLMGGADAIPGVSGGTIALIVGVYQRFVEALATAIKTPLLIRHEPGRTELKRAFGLLIPLGMGVLFSYYLVTKLLVGPKEHPGMLLRPDTAPAFYAFFFGLVLFSLREPWKRINHRGTLHFVAAALTCAGAFVFVGLPHATGQPETWMLALGGAGAIAVMLLPGVSGSMLLLILGQYLTVTGALHDRDVTTIAVFAGGICFGIIGFIPLLKHVLKRHHDLTMAALTGLMAGSLRALWPWKSNYNPKDGGMHNLGIGDDLPLVLVGLAAGTCVVFLLGKLERKMRAAH